MKKIILFPKTDTVILCLPEEWVDKPVICKLTPLYESYIKTNELTMGTERIYCFSKKKVNK